MDIVSQLLVDNQMDMKDLMAMLGSKSTEEPKSNKENVAVVEINQSDLEAILMKFSPLSIMKKKYTFEFIQEQNIETEEIKAADHLICWVEEENARIIDEESDASVVVVKRDKKGNILYAQSLEFPMDSETDFDSLLDKFYTRKPIKLIKAF